MKRRLAAIILCFLSSVAIAEEPTLRLGNVSVRGWVGTGPDVVILGFVIPEDVPLYTVLIRGRGPSLSAYGVPYALQDPVLTVYTASGQVFDSNDDWAGPERIQAIQATGLAPPDPRESAVLISLTPGAYTAVLTGKGGEGVGIIELFSRY